MGPNRAIDHNIVIKEYSRSSADQVSLLSLKAGQSCVCNADAKASLACCTIPKVLALTVNVDATFEAIQYNYLLSFFSISCLLINVFLV